MDFAFSKDQRMIQSSVREFLDKECLSDIVRELEEDEKGYDPVVWEKMAELGWMGIVLPEEYEGTEGDFIELMIVMEEMGRRLLPSPFFTTVGLCALPLSAFGTSSQKEAFLPPIAEGEKIWTLAFMEEDGSCDPSTMKLDAALDGDECVLSGTKLFVPYAHVADYFLVVGKEGEEIALFIVDAKTPGIEITSIPTTAHDKQYEVTFDKVRVSKENILGTPDTGSDIFDFILKRGAILKCAEMVGGANAAFELTNDYAKKRVQFDRPIGSFQAVQHRLANMWIDINGLRYLVYKAGHELSIESSEADLLVSMAKAKANEIYQRICIQSMTTHGAIGFTREQDVGLYHLRTKAFEFCCGDSGFHKDQIALALQSKRGSG
ncbi:MAG: acyl-CoA dehydrogenase [Desulfatiglans sp.]|jgi:alkylation response protein AidB-like acyl-CoA dehydrogenase|nr:acyl-CoA dehydrogenase [Thermodesulfobacteriota bacterium]MEE4353085.1 acyl-CoA dehydrogenase [Desulfatiglans sp.]